MEQISRLGRRLRKLPSWQIYNTIAKDGGSIFVFQYQPLLSIFSMAFPRSLSTGEMDEYVTYHFERDWCRVAFPPSSLPKDFQALYPSYELTVAEEAARRFELPELPKNTFESWVWLNGDRILEARFRAKVEQKEESSRAEREAEGSEEKTGERNETERELGTSPFPFIMAFPPLHNTKEMANFIRESFIRRWRRATRPPCPLPDDYQDLCPRFLLPKAERAVLDFELPEMVQATFYAMLLNDAIELGIVSDFLADNLKSTLERLRWTSFEAWLGRTRGDLREAQLRQRTLPSEAHGSIGDQAESSRSIGPSPPSSDEDTEQAVEYVQDNFRWTLRETSAPGPRPLPLDYRGLCSRFDLRVAARYAHDSNFLEMVQAILYAMITNDAAELGLSRKLTMDCVMWAMRKLDWGPIESWLGDIDPRLKRTQASQPANPPVGPALPGGPIGSRTTSSPAFRNTTHAAKYVRDNLR
ncbi:hypothetical protein Cgig2_013746 [Carnegiea gigantea]|uniref:Uncharacterized protein n=1 Tax=Carnegiea gigantea TaxID=171969 RepID=A0A9Q1GQN6_9CARY|nr:hypothetical protein Cgig2_013746 [Carnegiea gigantea]